MRRAKHTNRHEITSNMTPGVAQEILAMTQAAHARRMNQFVSPVFGMIPLLSSRGQALESKICGARATSIYSSSDLNGGPWRKFLLLKPGRGDEGDANVGRQGHGVTLAYACFGRIVISKTIPKDCRFRICNQLRLQESTGAVESSTGMRSPFVVQGCGRPKGMYIVCMVQKRC